MHCETKSTWRWFRKYHDPRKACREQDPRDATGENKKTQSTKSEIRNKFKWLKNTKFKTYSIRIRRFGFSEFEIYLTSSLFQISIFGLRILFRRLAAR
jgi:hypothetical protein